MFRMFPQSLYGQIEVNALSKRGRHMTLNVPSTVVVCPCCNGRAIQMNGCELCDGANVIETVADDFLKAYPLIDKAMRRYDRAEQADAWERYGERVWGC